MTAKELVQALQLGSVKKSKYTNFLGLTGQKDGQKYQKTRWPLSTYRTRKLGAF